MVCVIATFILATITPCLTLEEKPQPTPYQDWDYIVYTQRWPITACADWEQRSSKNTCNMPKDSNTWIVHGVWPTKTGMKGPYFCNSAIHFDPDQLKPMMDDLQEYWPNIENNTKPNSFWKHEWSKHGTCASVLPQLDSVTNYFKQGLMWNQDYKLSDILAKSKIVPDLQGYNVSDIYEAIVTVTNKNPVIQCVVDGKTKQSMISEIQICFNKDLELIHCNVTDKGEEGVLGNCNRKEDVMYLATVPNRTNYFEEVDYPDYVNDNGPILEEDCLINFAYEKELHKVYSIIKFLMWFTL